MEMVGDERIEDVRWLCSLPESELDLLVSLKQMAVRRATFVGHESLAKNFDLKTLRGLGFVLMQFLKRQLDDSSDSSCVDRSSLSRPDVDDAFREMGVEELMTYVGPDRRKRISDLFGEDFVNEKRKKNRP